MDFYIQPMTKRYSVWRIASLFAATGLAVTLLIFGANASTLINDLVQRHSDLVLLLCPPAIAGMAMEHAKGMELIEDIAAIATANAAIYFVLGLCVAIIWKLFRIFFGKR